MPTELQTKNYTNPICMLLTHERLPSDFHRSSRI